MFRISVLMVGFAAYVLSEPIQHCNYDTSVDISQGTHTSNGDINYHGERYQQHEYFFDENTRTQRGCICGKKICIRKCCPLGQGYTDYEICANESNLFDFPILDYYKDLKGVNVSWFHFLFDDEFCPNGIMMKLSHKTENLRLLEDGKLLIMVPSAVSPRLKYDPDEYCVDNFITKDPETKKKIIRIDALVCLPKDEEETNYFDYINFVGMLISCVFCIVTIAVYAWLPELRNMHGRVLMVYLACMCVGFALLSTMQIMLIVDNITMNICLGLTFAIYFSLISAFFWLNVMCFDIWWTFSGKRGRSLEKWSMRARFCVYAAYAFGFPTGFTVVLVALEFSDLPSHPLMPRLRLQGCYFYGTSELFFVHGPITILCIVNLVFFILTVSKINQTKNQMQKTLKSKDSCSTDQQRTDRFLLYVKIFTIMGISWILEVFKFIFPHAYYVWRFTNTYNIMTGFYIFVIFVCKKKILRLMKKRFNEMFRISQSDSGDLKPIGSRDDEKNWKEYQQQSSLDSVRTSISCDSDNSTTKTFDI